MKITVDLTREEADTVKRLWDWHRKNLEGMPPTFAVRQKIVKAIKEAGQ